MSLFNRKPKIIKGRSLDDYLSHYSKGYVTHKNEVITDKNNLKPNCRYYEIDGKYYQIDYNRWIKNTILTIGALSLACTIYLPIHFLVIAPMERYQDYNFKYWNNCESLRVLKSYVKNAVTPGNKYYVPKADRIATFDMDGTLYGERSPIYIEWLAYQDYFHNILKDGDHRKIDPVNLPNEDKTKVAEYPTISILPTDVDTALDQFISQGVEPEVQDQNGHGYASLEMAEAYCGAQVFSNIFIEDYIKYVESYLEKPAANFNNLLYKDMVYKPMDEVVDYLQQNNFDVYVVSATDRFMIRTIINHHFNISVNKVLGMDVELLPDEATGKMVRTKKLRYKNSKKVKTELITREIGKSPILSFGNSSGDEAMHDLALANPNYKSLAFMNVADDQERERGYTPEEIEHRIENWDNYHLFSMKNDWKTIYGKNVTLKQPE